MFLRTQSYARIQYEKKQKMRTTTDYIHRIHRGEYSQQYRDVYDGILDIASFLRIRRLTKQGPTYQLIPCSGQSSSLVLKKSGVHTPEVAIALIYELLLIFNFLLHL